MRNWQDAEQHADRALDLFERGRWSEAETELRKALDIDPDQGDWHFNLGLTLERCGRDAEALSSYEQASRLLPEAVAPQLAAGSVCLRLGPSRAAVLGSGPYLLSVCCLVICVQFWIHNVSACVCFLGYAEFPSLRPFAISCEEIYF